MRRIKQRAQEEEHAPLTPQELLVALKSMAPNKAQGVDMLSPPDLQRLPPAAFEELASLLNQCEAAMAWPAQLMYVVGALLPKPDNGDRVVGLLPLHVKLWSRARASITDEWSDKLEEFWDTAIQGSSALRAALIRSLLDESALALGFATCTLLLDLIKFFDSISFVKLLDAALDAEYPAVVVGLETLAYAAPRRLRKHALGLGGDFSAAIYCCGFVPRREGGETFPVPDPQEGS